MALDRISDITRQIDHEIQIILDEIESVLAPGGGSGLGDPGSNGILVRTALGVTASRSLAAPSAGFTITNGDGVSGNPTFALADDLAALEALSTTGFAKRTGTSTWTAAALASGDIPDISATYATKAYADSLVVGLLDDRGNYDSSGNAFPSSGGSGTAGAILKGDLWTISVAGTLGGHPVTPGDVVRALVNTPGSTDSNWAISENNFGFVPLNAASNLSDLANAGTARTNLGATTVGSSLFTATNPSAISFPKIAADNSVSFRTPAQVLSDIGASTLTNSAGANVVPKSNGTNLVASRITDGSNINIGFAMDRATSSIALVGDNANPIAIDSVGSSTIIGDASGAVNGTTLIVDDAAQAIALLAANGATLNGSALLVANQPITLSGDVSGSGATAITTTIGAGKVTLAMQANMATASLVYRKTAGSGAPEVNTLATLKTDLGLSGTNSGDVTLAGENYLSITGQAITANPVALGGSNVSGVLTSAKGGTGVNNAGTFTNATNSAITGGGTLALAGFTFTIPATGTAVLTSRTITEGAGLAGNTYDLSANRTLAMGAPSTLTVSASNSASGTTHSHAITSSSNPGAAASLLATDASGYLTTVRHTVTDYLFVNAATANVYLKDTSTGFQSATTLIVTPQANNSFRSTSYTSGLVGWSINALGSAEFDNVDIRGAIHAGIFTYNSINVTAGTQLITPSGAKLKSDVTVTASPTYGTTTFTVDAVDQDGITHAASQLFAVNDIIRLKDGLVGDTWFKVTAVSDQTTFWRYTASIQAGTANVTYRAGQGIPDYGVSGKGGIMLTADQTNSPYLQMFTHAGTFSSADASGSLTLTPQLRLGNLNGSYGFSSDIYGLGAGQYGVAGKSWVIVDPTNGVRIGNNTTTKISLDASGNASFSGSVTASAGTIGGFSITSTYINNGTTYFASGFDVPAGAHTWFGKSATGYSGMGLNDGTRILRFRLGDGSIYPYIQVWDGSHNRVVIGGLNNDWGDGLSDGVYGMKIFNSSGTKLVEFSDARNIIGGWTIGATTITAGSATLDSAGKLSLGTGNNIAILDAADATYRLAIGNATYASAPFRVDKTGALTATSATITGTINATAGNFSGIALTGTMTVSGGAIGIGATSVSAGTGLWMNSAGITGLLSGVVQAKFDAATGAITAGAGNVKLNANGLRLIAGTGGSNSVSWVDGSSIVQGLIFADTSANLNLQSGTGSIKLQSDSSLRAYSISSGFTGFTIGANSTPSAMLDVRGGITGTGVLVMGSGPTTLTDSAGKILSAALNTVGAAQGGTGIASYAVGDLLYASGSTTLSKLADVAVGSVLVSGGVTTAPAWSSSPTISGTLSIGDTAAGSYAQLIPAASGTSPKLRLFNRGEADGNITVNSVDGFVLDNALKVNGALVVTGAISFPALTLKDATNPFLRVWKTSVQFFDWTAATSGKLNLLDTSGTVLMSAYDAGGIAVGVAVNKGAGTLNVASNLYVGAPINMKGYTVATLPAGTQGDVAYVTDALAPGFLVAVVGGGAIVTPVFRNASAWVAF